MLHPPYQDSGAFPKSHEQMGRVVENADPLGLGRVKVQMMWQEAGSEKTPWIRLLQPHSGSGKGFYFVPEIGEEVLVGFQGGNAEKPYVIGTQYNGKEKSGYADKENCIKAVHTRSGHKLVFTEFECILITDNYVNEILLDTKGSNITITAPETMTLNAKNLNINVSQNMTTNVGNNMITNVTNDTTISIGGNHQIDIEKDHQFSSKNYAQKVEGDKIIDIFGKLDETTSETLHNAKDGNVTIKSAGISKLLGEIDAKVNKS